MGCFTRAVLASVLFAAAGAPFLLAEGGVPLPTYSTYVDWKNNQVTIDANIDLGSSDTLLPNARLKGEALVRDNLQTMATKALYPIVLSSFQTIGDRAAQSPKIASAVGALLQPADEQYAALSGDLRQLTVRYTMPLFPDIASVFVNQTHANPPPQLLQYVPTTAFSGIVIYAEGVLPVHGENTSQAVVPCLFPRIFDENMDLLASADTVDPAALKKWGVAAYTDSTDEKPFTQRIGLVPFHTVATAVFGKHYTDVIISNDAAQRILASKQNIDLLTQGRVLIITELPPAPSGS